MVDDSMIPSEKAVKSFINPPGRRECLQRRIPFLAENSMFPIAKIGPYPQSFVRYKKRADAKTIQQKVLSRFKTKTKIKKLGTGKAARYYLLSEDKKTALTRFALDAMMDAIVEEEPDLFLDMPRADDYAIVIGRTTRGTTKLDIYKIKNHAFDPNDDDSEPIVQERWGVDEIPEGSRRVKSMFDGYFKGSNVWKGHRAFYFYEDNKDKVWWEFDGVREKLLGPGVWEVLDKIMSEPIPIEASVWIRSPSLPFQRVSDIGEAPKIEPADVSNIKLGEKQRKFLNALVNDIESDIKKNIEKFRKYDSINDTERADAALKTIRRLRNLDTIREAESAFVDAGMKRGTKMLKTLENKALLTFTEDEKETWNYKAKRSVIIKTFSVRLRPETLLVLKRELPAEPKPTPANLRKTTEQIVEDALLDAARTAAGHGIGEACKSAGYAIREGKHGIEVERGKYEVKEDDRNDYDATVLYPHIITTHIKYPVTIERVRRTFDSDVKALYENEYEDTLAEGITPDMADAAREGIVAHLERMHGIRGIFDIYKLFNPMMDKAREQEPLKFDISDKKYPNIREEWPKGTSWVDLVDDTHEVPTSSIKTSIGKAEGERAVLCEFDVKIIMKVRNVSLRKPALPPPIF